MPGRLSQRTRSVLIGGLAATAVGVLVAALAVWRPAFVERTEAWAYDVRARAIASPAAASSEITLITISEGDLENAENVFGMTWPWPREAYATLTEYAHQAGAKVVVFDWLFQDRGYSANDAETFAAAMRTAGNVVIGLAVTKAALVQRPAQGARIAQFGRFATEVEARAAALALAAWNIRSYLLPGAAPTPVELWIGGKATDADLATLWQRVIASDDLRALMPGLSDDGPPAEPPLARALTDAEQAREFAITPLIEARDGLALTDPRLPRRDGLDPPLAILAAAPARMGSVFQPPDPDGMQRRHTPLVRAGLRAYPSLALAALLVGNPSWTPRLDDGVLRLGPHAVRLDDDGAFALRFHGKTVYPQLSAFEVLRSSVLVSEGQAPSVPAGALAGKYVFVAAAAHALRDLRPTPVAVDHLGAAIQATALDNLLTGRTIARAPAWLDALAGFGLCLVLGFVMAGLWRVIARPDLAFVLTGVVTLGLLWGYFRLTQALLDQAGLWMAVTVPIAGAVAAGFTAMLAVSAQERRGRRFVQEALGRYTSTALVKELVEHPEHLSLEWGERRPMSVYFSDIAGFTTISESLSPEDLVALLNDYLTNMTELVLAHGGVVDKYIGDAVMAFWGAPIPDPNHALRAVRCAIAMRARCLALESKWLGTYGHRVTARAGVNSGDAVVGNMGSKHKYNYTVMGDMVNLASRLEGANKAYGTLLLINQTTAAALGDAIDLRELDRVAVKGKHQPVTIYEVLGERGQTPADLCHLAAQFAVALAHYQARDFATARRLFADLVAAHPSDGPSQLYVARCEDFIAQPPAVDWDGVARMTEK